MNKKLKEGIRRLLPRSPVPHKILGGPLRGNLIVTSWHDYPGAIVGTTERALLESFRKHAKSGQTWLDIGAHYGYTAIALSKLVGPSGRVFAFEPMLNTVGCISRSRRLNNFQHLTVIPMALGNCSELTSDSLLTVRGMIDSTLVSSTGFKEPFLVSALDWLWPKISNGNTHIDGIKIDVQGMEIQALEGMAALAKRYRPKLYLEIHKGVSRPKLLRLIQSLGYDPVGLPVDPIPGEADAEYPDDRTYLFGAPSEDKS